MAVTLFGLVEHYEFKDIERRHLAAWRQVLQARRC
jgi:hypothetical protein